MTTEDLGMGKRMEPRVVIFDLLGSSTVIVGPEGERYGGRSMERRRKSVVPVSASVCMTFCCEVGEEEFVLNLLCLVLLRHCKVKSSQHTSSPPCQPLVLPPATSVGVLALSMEIVNLDRSASMILH